MTVAQYAAFVQATGASLPEGKADHPVVDVSWHDAIAYCRWLAEVTGRPYHLPSEAEWEKAARGTDGRTYPWGDEWDANRCNTAEGSKGGTTAVGAYPRGASPYGCLDMAGNVWEWTRSLWGKDWSEPQFRYPYDPNDGRENLDAPGDVRRVLRGGSFAVDSRYVRCAFRYNIDPGSWYRYDGLRVVILSLGFPF